MTRPANQVETGANQVSEQPFLHELTTVLHAPGLALSSADGQIREGAHGAYWADRRILSRLVVAADGREPASVRATRHGDRSVRFLGVLRNLGDTGADPTVTIQRDREVVDRGLVERITINSAARDTVATNFTVEIGCDDAEMAAVKSGHPAVPLPTYPVEGGLEWRADGGRTVRVRCEPPPDVIEGAVLGWRVELSRGAVFSATVHLEVVDTRVPVVLPPSEPRGRATSLSIASGDHRLAALVEQSLADLEGLVLADPLEPTDTFLAAGAPWFLTLFGRDAIWAARMLLPLGTELAAGTLRALARRQGTVVDPDSAQEPGKIMHEIRPGPTRHDDGAMTLPPLYYGTVDATALWISLLHDAWRWGLPEDEVIALLPTLDRAMGWLIDYGAHESGFVSYRDVSGRGLANQGWKDSGDAVQFRDGSLAEAPIALCEVQGYAYAAAHQAADLAEAFGHASGPAWRAWAEALAARFRDRFWVDDDTGRYPAIAVDARGRVVDTVTSNIAHLLGTGLLDAEEERHVVARLAGPDMDSGFGLRTLSATASGFNPLGYHAGSVWTHDTAIAIGALSTSDTPDADRVAASLAGGLLAAAPAFGFRMPELFGGHSRAEYPDAVPYPAACRPQAWSATASIAIIRALLGLEVDVPGATLRMRPIRPCPVGALSLRGLRFGDHEFAVRLDQNGDPTVEGLPRHVRVEVG